MKGFFRSTLITLIVIIIVAIGFWFCQSAGLFKPSAPRFSKNSYQAVFLSNGQVYFGKVKNLGRQYVVVTDTYYLIRGESIQSQTAGAEGEIQPQTAFGLRKLGENEIHGPVDEMVINRDHILFVEELKDEGALVQAINRKKESLTQPTAEPSPSITGEPTE